MKDEPKSPLGLTFEETRLFLSKADEEALKEYYKMGKGGYLDAEELALLKQWPLPIANSIVQRLQALGLVQHHEG